MPHTDNQGVRIHYEVEGEGEGSPLVLQHGFTSSLQAWRQFGYVQALSRDFEAFISALEAAIGQTIPQEYRPLVNRLPRRP